MLFIKFILIFEMGHSKKSFLKLKVGTCYKNICKETLDIFIEVLK